MVNVAINTRRRVYYGIRLIGHRYDERPAQHGKSQAAKPRLLAFNTLNVYII